MSLREKAQKLVEAQIDFNEAKDALCWHRQEYLNELEKLFGDDAGRELFVRPGLDLCYRILRDGSVEAIQTIEDAEKEAEEIAEEMTRGITPK